jgi:hypothetical protein
MVTVLVEPLYLKIRRREAILGSPASDEGARGTAVATGLRPLIDRVSESGDIDPGHAGNSGTPQSGDHLPAARSAITTDICADGGSQRQSELCNTSQKQPLMRKPSSFHAKRQELLEKYISYLGVRDQFITSLLQHHSVPKRPVGAHRGQIRLRLGTRIRPLAGTRRRDIGLPPVPVRSNRQARGDPAKPG